MFLNAKQFFWLPLALLLGCGGPQLDRLVGEPASNDRFTTPVSNRVHPAIDSIQRFVAAMQQNDADRAWLQLSGETRKALQTRADLVGLRGVDLLRLHKLPTATSMTTAASFEPLTFFALPTVQSMQLAQTPPREDVVEQRVHMTGLGGASRTVVLRFEGYRWRIHRPDLLGASTAGSDPVSGYDRLSQQ